MEIGNWKRTQGLNETFRTEGPKIQRMQRLRPAQQSQYA